MKVSVLFVLFVTMLMVSLHTGCDSRSEQQATAPDPQSPFKPATLEGAGIENLHEIAPGVYSGGQPEGDAGFETLRKLGIRTIINVDGAQPDIERAGERGMKYVHLPIGYDGIDPEMASRIAKASTVTEGPVFIHCHHGKHRGPAAAAVWCITSQDWTNEQALQWLEDAGTSDSYQGLYAVAREFEKPSDEALAAIPDDFPEAADTPPLVRMMVETDYRWEHLRDIRKAGYRTPDHHPDLDPAHEALLLMELYHEAGRLDESHALGTDFLAQLKQAEENARKLHEYLKAPRNGTGDAAFITAADELFKTANQDCKSCHEAYRN